MKFTRQLIWIGVFFLFALSSCSQRAKIVPREALFPEISPGLVNIMTFNIRCGSANDGDNSWVYRKDIVFDTLADHSVDIIGLQEALYFQIQDIKRALPQYKIISVGRDAGGRVGEACPILYRRDRFSVADTGTFWFSNMPWKPGSRHWGNKYPRICTWARLTETVTGKSFYVYNLHLDHQSQSSRQHSMNLLGKEIAKRKYRDPVIVMGDFNMDTDNSAMASLLGMGTFCLPMVDVWHSLHPDQPGITTFHAFGKKPAGPCLDHILIDETVEIVEVAVDARTFGGRYPSDHFPVTAHLQIYNISEGERKFSTGDK